ncbi:unnamed protein product [Natator depressus]
MQPLDQWFSVHGLLAAQSAHSCSPCDILRAIQVVYIYIVWVRCHITHRELCVQPTMVNRLRITALDYKEQEKRTYSRLMGWLMAPMKNCDVSRVDWEFSNKMLICQTRSVSMTRDESGQDTRKDLAVALHTWACQAMTAMLGTSHVQCKGSWLCGSASGKGDEVTKRHL